MPWKLMLAVALVACAVGGFAAGFVWATPGADISTTIISGRWELSGADPPRGASKSAATDLRHRNP